MSTSNHSPHSPLLRRTVVAGAAAAAVALVLSPSDPAMTSTPIHPAWVIALVLAARAGARGLYAVPAVVLGVQLAEWIAGRADVGMLARLGTPGELALLVTIAGLAAVGTAHETRKARLEARLQDAEQRAHKAESAIDELSETAIALRDRCDRSQTSLAFLTDLAARMDDPDPAGAGDAALALAMARTGARGGFVQLLDGGRLRTVCARGAWSADRISPPTLFRDLVAVAALDQERPIAAHEVERASAEDSDLAAPLIGSDGSTIGVLALRGVAYPALNAAAREDLAAVARWAGRSFIRPRGAGPTAIATRGGRGAERGRERGLDRAAT